MAEILLLIKSACFLLVIVSFSLFVQFGRGSVEIVKPYYPLYIKAGGNLTISCEIKATQSAADLRWVQQTPLTSWIDSPVTAVLGSNIIIQSFREEPSRFTRTTLIKLNMSLLDRGTYICKDDTSSYAVWVIVIYITAQNRTHLSSEDKPLILGCNISGFDSNIPKIVYDWTFKELFISHPNSTTVRHSAILQAPVDKYKVKMENNELQLQIHDPNYRDGGTYKCIFTLGTNFGPITFSESVYVDGSRLKPGNSGVKMSISFCSVVVTVVVVFLSCSGNLLLRPISFQCS